MLQETVEKDIAGKSNLTPEEPKQNSKQITLTVFNIAISCVEAKVGFDEKTEEIMHDLAQRSMNLSSEFEDDQQKRELLGDKIRKDLQAKMDGIDDSCVYNNKETPQAHAYKYIGALYETIPNKAKKDLVDLLDNETKEHLGKGAKIYRKSNDLSIEGNTLK